MDQNPFFKLLKYFRLAVKNNYFLLQTENNIESKTCFDELSTCLISTLFESLSSGDFDENSEDLELMKESGWGFVEFMMTG